MSDTNTKDGARVHLAESNAREFCHEGLNGKITNPRLIDHYPVLTNKAIKRITEANVSVRLSLQDALREAMKTGIEIQNLTQRLSLESLHALFKQRLNGPTQCEVNAYLRFVQVTGFVHEDMQADIALPNLAPLLRELADAFELLPKPPECDCNRDSSTSSTDSLDDASLSRAGKGDHRGD